MEILDATSFMILAILEDSLPAGPSYHLAYQPKTRSPRFQLGPGYRSTLTFTNKLPLLRQSS